MIEVETTEQVERDFKGLFYILIAIIFILCCVGAYLRSQENLPVEPKARNLYYILPQAMDTYFNMEKEAWPYGIKPE